MGAVLPKPGDHPQRLILGGILLLGLLNGLLFIFMMPPWQHYDEPGHFEYAWLMANRDDPPEKGEYDQGMRRELAASMIEHNFFAEMGFLPNLLAQNEPVWIGISQAGDVPVYYWLVSLPLRLIRTTDLAFQLYAARLVSLVMYLVTILGAYGLVSEITPKNSALRWLVPLVMVCLPGFTDLMTAVNNDVGAVTFLTLFLWAAVHMIRLGFSWLRAATCLILALFCMGTKATVFYTVLLFPLAVLLSIRGQTKKKWTWIVFCVLCIVVIGVVFSLKGSSGWYLRNLGKDYRREVTPIAVAGDAVMRLQGSSEGWTQLYSPLEYQQVEVLRGQTASLGAWMWADQLANGRALVVEDDSGTQTDIVELGITPAFYCLPIHVGDDSSYVNVQLNSASAETAASNPLYVDGVILVVGDYCDRGIPIFTSQTGNTLEWDGDSLENLVQNGSFEQPALMIRPDVLSPLLGEWFTVVSQTVTSLGDWSSSSWYYQETIMNLLHTFWGKFGWAHIPLIGGRLYLPLAVITLFGGFGAGLAVWNRRANIDWRIAGLLLLALILGWAMAFGRGIGSLSGQVFIGSARYAYPVMVLTVIVLVAGWNELLGYASHYLPPINKWKYWIYGLGFLSLNLCAWWSIQGYYSQLP